MVTSKNHHGNTRSAYQSGSVLGGLLDVRFTRTVTPRLVGWLYAGAAVAVGFGCLAGLAVIWSLATWAGWGWWLFVPILLAGALVVLLAVRVVLEWVLMAFTRGRPVTPVPQGPPHGQPHGRVSSGVPSRGRGGGHGGRLTA